MLVLAHHNLTDWAESMKARLIALGCSDDYAEKARLQIIARADS